MGTAPVDAGNFLSWRICSLFVDLFGFKPSTMRKRTLQWGLHVSHRMNLNTRMIGFIVGRALVQLLDICYIYV